jgi:hypothetical protein
METSIAQWECSARRKSDGEESISWSASYDSIYCSERVEGNILI